MKVFLLNMFLMLLHSSSGAGVGCYPNAGWSTECSNLHSDTTLLQPNRTNTPVHTETVHYTHIQSSAPEDECNNIRNMLSKKNFHKVTSSWFNLFNKIASFDGTYVRL